jgi:hypothetical protein
MNFKSTTAKTLTSIFIGLILGYLSIVFRIFQGESGCRPDNGTTICWDVGTSYLPVLIIFVISIIIVYVIWSLVSKK